MSDQPKFVTVKGVGTESRYPCGCKVMVYSQPQSSGRLALRTWCPKHSKPAAAKEPA
jgi:hypothetical protein